MGGGGGGGRSKILLQLAIFRTEKKTGTEMCPGRSLVAAAIVSRIVTGKAPVSYWATFPAVSSYSPRSLCES